MKTVAADSFLALAQTSGRPIVDVRSPSEYADGHIPGAHSIPLFTDEERAHIGTTYRVEGREQAVLEGLSAVGPKLRTLADRALAVAGADGEVLLHCWRGGMRSQSAGWLYERAGLGITLLDGGYKAYRAHVRTLFEKPLPALLVVGGLTGSGKTDVLHRLAERGEQVIDLEGLANHRGSAFGGIERQCPTQEHFENQLAHQIAAVDPARPIWIEDESRLIGKLVLPQSFWNQKIQAPVAFLCVEQDMRVARLVEEYGDHSPDALAGSFEAIRKRLGHQRTDEALDALRSGHLSTACAEALAYYDKCYLHGLSRRSEAQVTHIERHPSTPEELATALISWAHDPGKTTRE